MTTIKEIEEYSTLANIITECFGTEYLSKFKTKRELTDLAKDVVSKYKIGLTAKEEYEKQKEILGEDIVYYIVILMTNFIEDKKINNQDKKKMFKLLSTNFIDNI